MSLPSADEILEMPAGAELDALIARWVMGERTTTPPYSTDLLAAWSVLERVFSIRSDAGFPRFEIAIAPRGGPHGDNWVCQLTWDEIDRGYSKRRTMRAVAPDPPLAISRGCLAALLSAP